MTPRGRRDLYQGLAGAIFCGILAFGVECAIFGDQASPRPGSACAPDEELGPGARCYPRIGAGLDDAGICHRQCKAILPGGSQSDAGEYSYRCGPCLQFCQVVINGNPVVTWIPASDAGCSAFGDGGS